MLSILNRCPQYPAPHAQLERVLGGTWKRRGCGRVTLNLMLVEDRQMRRLNQGHRKRRTTTDVLAFADGDADPVTRVNHLGDIAVSVDTARREAKKRNLRIRDEVTLYALHGLLHLLGMRDDTEAGRKAMVQAQVEVFRQYGLSVDMVLDDE